MERQRGLQYEHECKFILGQMLQVPVITVPVHTGIKRHCQIWLMCSKKRCSSESTSPWKRMSAVFRPLAEDRQCTASFSQIGHKIVGGWQGWRTGGTTEYFALKKWTFALVSSCSLVLWDVLKYWCTKNAVCLIVWQHIYTYRYVRYDGYDGQRFLDYDILHRSTDGNGACTEYKIFCVCRLLVHSPPRF